MIPLLYGWKYDDNYNYRNEEYKDEIVSMQILKISKVDWELTIDESDQK